MRRDHFNFWTGRSDDTESYWLRAIKPVGSPSRYVALAFRLKTSENAPRLDPTRPLVGQVTIAPVDGQLSIYFPAEKETTKLKFHIHGPYSAPVDRASIKHSSDNSVLLEATAQLLAETLDTIKARELLTVGFLDVLPNPDDALDPFYGPLLAALIDAMRTRPFVPVDKGGHSAARELLRGPAAVRAVLDADRLTFYTAIKGVRWAAGTMQRQRADKLLAALDIAEWSWNDLLERTDHLFARTSLTTSSNRWLTEQPVEWLQSFYALLGELLMQRYTWGTITHIWDPKDSCKQWSIVRTSDGSIMKGGEVFFAGPRSGPADSMFPSTESELLVGTKKQQIERAKDFLEVVGVRVLGERERLLHILRTCYSKAGPFPAWDEHLGHLQRFIAEWERTKDASIFKDAYLFWEESGHHCIQGATGYLVCMTSVIDGKQAGLDLVK